MTTFATAHAGDADTLERVARFDGHGQPVLSVYIDLDPGRFPTPETPAAPLGSLLAAARRQDAAAEADRVEAWLSSEPTIVRGARALAIFSSEGGHLLEAVRLTKPVEPLAIVDTISWLEPLADTISPGTWGVAIVSPPRSTAAARRTGWTDRVRDRHRRASPQTRPGRLVAGPLPARHRRAGGGARTRGRRPAAPCPSALAV